MITVVPIYGGLQCHGIRSDPHWLCWPAMCDRQSISSAAPDPPPSHTSQVWNVTRPLGTTLPAPVPAWYKQSHGACQFLAIVPCQIHNHITHAVIAMQWSLHWRWSQSLLVCVYSTASVVLVPAQHAQVCQLSLSRLSNLLPCELWMGLHSNMQHGGKLNCISNAERRLWSIDAQGRAAGRAKCLQAPFAENSALRVTGTNPCFDISCDEYNLIIVLYTQINQKSIG